LRWPYKPQILTSKFANAGHRGSTSACRGENDEARSPTWITFRCRHLLHCICRSLALNDGPPFSGRPSLTVHCGHGWTCSLPRPVATDPIGDLARFLLGSVSPLQHQLTTSTHNASAKVRVWPIIELARYFTGSVRNRSLEGIKGGSAITAVEVCCPSSIRRKSPMALVMFSLNFAPA
jgi:hypothetical protein